MKEKMTIRKSVMQDAAVIAANNMAMALETENKVLTEAVVLRGVKAVMKDERKGFYLLAEMRDPNPCIVGQLLVTYEWSDWRGKFFWWVQSVYVQPSYRGQGIFKDLYRFIEEKAQLRKDVSGLRLYVEKHNDKAKSAYESLGMIKTYYDLYEKEF